MRALNLDDSSHKGLITSLTLHVCVFTALIIGLYLNKNKTDTPQHVFELVARIPYQLPSKEKPEELTAVIEIPKVKPKQPKPEPKIVKPPIVPSPKKISYKDFIKDHGKPKTNPKPKPKTISKTELKVLETPDVRKILLDSLTKSNPPNPRSTANKISQRELDLYISKLRDQINRSWLIPDDAYYTNLSAKVKFTVDPYGKVTSAKIIKSSGNREFDSSILSAFGRIGRVSKTPNKEAITIRLTFKAEK